MKTAMGIFIILLLTLLIANTSYAQTDVPYFQQDRGTGQATSMFGTYISKGEVIIYPFYEYYYDHNAEYKPAELGYGLDQDFFGKSTGHEALLFLGFGVTDRLALEFETAYIKQTLNKSPEDPSSMPATIEESGIGDVEGQIRYRWNFESDKKPEYYSYFEYVLPFQKEKKLIGTHALELKLGTGLIKGYKWGTMTVRAAVEYDGSESKVELGEFAVEYLKRVSRMFRFAVVIEGTQDEVELITDLQFHVSQHAFIRVNNAFGITPKATDYAPEFGVLFHF